MNFSPGLPATAQLPAAVHPAFSRTLCEAAFALLDSALSTRKP